MLSRTMRIVAGNHSILRHGLARTGNGAEMVNHEPVIHPKVKEIVFQENQGCLGEKDRHDDNDCGYGTKIACEQCIFVVQQHTTDKRFGKRPWAKCNQN